MTGPDRHDGTARRALDASMTLLNEVYRRPLDPGYALAAQRRAARGEPPRRVRAVAGLVVLAVVLGLATTAATLALRQPAGSALSARQLLERQIEQRTQEADDLQQQISDLTAEIAQLQSEALGGGSPLLAQNSADAVAAAVVPVTGPGLRVVLTDAPTDDPDTQDPDERVQDVDLQVLVNGLWAAGAEAIAVNGQRLGAMTAIRSAGTAVLVDLVPLSSPYTVDAIGGAPAMQTELARTAAGQHLATLRSTYGIGVQITSQRHLELPGTGQLTLRSAGPPRADDGTAAARAASGSDDVAVSGRRSGKDGV